MHRVRNPKSMIITMQGNHSSTDKLIELLKNVPITCIVSVYINYNYEI